MKWEDFQDKQYEISQEKTLTDIECPKCGKNLYRINNVVLTTYPPQHRYECECGWIGTA